MRIMNVIKGPYYSLIYRILSITGLWPYQSEPQKWIRRMITAILLQTLIVPMWLGLFEAWGDMNLTIECIPPIILNTVSFMMFLNFIIMHKELELLLRKIENDWIIWSTEPEIEILEKYAKKGTKFRLIYAVSLLSALSGFLAVPGLPQILDLMKPLNESRPRDPIYVGKYGFDGEKYYNTIFLHSYIMSIIALLILMNGDMIFMACTQHACGILAVMGSKLANLVSDTNFYSYYGISCQKRIDEKIIYCVKQHEDLIRFLQNIHKCFSFILFVTVSLNMLIMSVTGVLAVMNLNHPDIALRFSIATSGQMIHLLFLTIPCQQMSDHSVKISYSAYESNWYLLPIRSRKLLMMIMRRSSEPFEFMVGKLYTYSMKNFAMVIKTSISYFTVLSSVQ